MKKLNTKSSLEFILVLSVLIGSVIIGFNIYQNVKHVCLPEIEAAGISCFYDMID